MSDRGTVKLLLGLVSPGVVAVGILAAAWLVTRGAAHAAWWTVHAGAVVVGASVIIGAALEMNRSIYPPGAVLSSAFTLAVALLASASILRDPARGSLLVPIWGSAGGFLLILLPRRGTAPELSGWALLGGVLLLAAGVVLATFILAS